MVNKLLRTQDTLLSQSKVWLFGRVMADITINVAAYDVPKDDKSGSNFDQPPTRSANNFLLNQLAQAKDPKFARIVGFSYEGAFYDLARPTLFLVHGDGIDAETPDESIEPRFALLTRAPPNFGRTGLGTQFGSFSSTVRAWAYDRADFTVRLDAETGSFDALLLASELGAWDAPAQSSGSLARAAGSLARSAGSLARSAGSLARSSRGRNGNSGTDL
jgi:hypothetical protein